MHLRGLSKVFFSVSNEKVDGGEAVQKNWQEEDLDGEVENVDGVAELRKRTGSKTSSYENNSNVIVMHDSAMNKITIFIAYILIVRNCLLYCRIFTLLCVKKGTLLMSASNKLSFSFS